MKAIPYWCKRNKLRPDQRRVFGRFEDHRGPNAMLVYHLYDSGTDEVVVDAVVDAEAGGICLLLSIELLVI